MSIWGLEEHEEKGVRIKINGIDIDDLEDEQIRHFVQALDSEMKKNLFEFLERRHSVKFKRLIRIISEEIQRHDTESRFPLTRSEIIEILIKIMNAYDKVPEEDRKILMKILQTKELKETMSEVELNLLKIMALNKAIRNVNLADGAVAFIELICNSSDEKKGMAIAGINFILKFEIGNPEATFRLLKLIDEKIEIINTEKEAISTFLNLLDPDFLEIHLGDRLNKEIKQLIVKRLVYASSELKWIPKTLAVRQADYKITL